MLMDDVSLSIKSLLGFYPLSILYFEKIPRAKANLGPASIRGSVELSCYCFAQLCSISSIE